MKAKNSNKKRAIEEVEDDSVVDVSDEVHSDVSGDMDDVDGEVDGNASDALSDDDHEEKPSSHGNRKAKRAKKQTTPEGPVLLTEADLAAESFAVQSKALLSQVGVPATHYTFLESWMRDHLPSLLSTLKAHHVPSIHAVLEQAGVASRLESSPENDRGMDFAAPAAMHPFGPYLFRCMITPACRAVDIALQMPSSCLLAKDHTHGRYARVRAAYLLTVQSQLLKSSRKGLKIAADFVFPGWAADGYEQPPVLLVQLSGKDMESPVHLRLHATVDTERFSLATVERRGEVDVARDMTLRSRYTELHSFVSSLSLHNQRTLVASLQLAMAAMQNHNDLPHMVDISSLVPVLIQIVRAKRELHGARLKEHLQTLLHELSKSLPHTSAAGQLVAREAGYVSHVLSEIFKAQNALDVFRNLFFVLRSPYSCYDGVVVLSPRKSAELRRDPASALTNILGLCTHIQNALAGRIVSVRPLHVDGVKTNHSSGSPVVLAFDVLDYNEAFKQVIMGPLPEAPEAEIKAFESVWKQRAEKRRFKDGQIRHAVVFAANGRPKFAVLEDMFRHLADDNAASLIYELTLEQSIRKASAGTDGVADISHASLTSTFNELSVAVTTSGVLGLDVLGMHCVDPVMRATLPISELSDDRYVLQTLVMLETSGRWPTDPEAVSRVKCAMLLRLAQHLESTLHTACRVTPGYLDVNMKRSSAKVTFRVILIDEPRDPRIAHALSLQDVVLRHAGRFAEACICLHDWLSNHGMTRYLSHEAIELLMKDVFEHALRPPQSAWAAFLAALEILAEGLKVIKEDSSTSVSESKNKRRNRKQPVMERGDEDANVTAHRFQVLAKRTLKQYQQLLVQDVAAAGSAAKFRKHVRAKVLVANESARRALVVSDMDLMITLHSFATTAARQSWAQYVGLDSLFGLYPERDYVDALRQRFADVALFFEFDNQTVGVKFRPHAFVPQPLRITSAICSMPAETDENGHVTHVLPNMFEFITDIRSIGKGLAERVDFVVRGDAWAEKLPHDSTVSDDDAE